MGTRPKRGKPTLDVAVVWPTELPPLPSDKVWEEPHRQHEGQQCHGGTDRNAIVLVAQQSISPTCRRDVVAPQSIPSPKVNPCQSTTPRTSFFDPKQGYRADVVNTLAFVDKGFPDIAEVAGVFKPAGTVSLTGV